MNASIRQAVARVTAWHASRLPLQAQIVPPEPVMPPAPPPVMPPGAPPIGDPQPSTPPAVDPPPMPMQP